MTNNGTRTVGDTATRGSVFGQRVQPITVVESSDNPTTLSLPGCTCDDPWHPAACSLHDRMYPSSAPEPADGFEYTARFLDVDFPLGVLTHVLVDTEARTVFVIADPRQQYADGLAAALRKLLDTNSRAALAAAEELDKHDTQRPTCVRGNTWCNNWHISPFTPCDGPQISVPTPGVHPVPDAVNAHLASAKLQDYACSGEYTAPQVSLYASECLDIDDPAEVLLLADQFAAFAEQLRGLGHQLAAIRRNAPVRVSEVGE